MYSLLRRVISIFLQAIPCPYFSVCFSFLFCFVVVNGTCRTHCRVHLILSTTVIKHTHWQTCVEHVLCDEDTASTHKKPKSEKGTQLLLLSSICRDRLPFTAASKSSSEGCYFLRCCGNLLVVVVYLFGLPKANNNPWAGSKVGAKGSKTRVSKIEKKENKA